MWQCLTCRQKERLIPVINFYLTEAIKFRSIGVLEKCLASKIMTDVSGSFHLDINTIASDLRFLQRNTLKRTWMDRIAEP